MTIESLAKTVVAVEPAVPKLSLYTNKQSTNDPELERARERERERAKLVHQFVVTVMVDG
jgi:hypothetical protein